jgi:hypothetical protein
MGCQLVVTFRVARYKEHSKLEHNIIVLPHVGELPPDTSVFVETLNVVYDHFENSLQINSFGLAFDFGW